MRTLKFFLLSILGLILCFGTYLWSSQEERSVRELRLKRCQNLLLPEVERKYQSMGYTLGEPKTWYDWMSPEEFATYPLLKNGKHENKKSVIISTVAGDTSNSSDGCRVEDIEYSLKD